MADNESNGVRSSLAAGCDAFYFCDLCVQDEESIEAFGFCMDCKDYLCRECFHTHLRPKPSRSHVLLDQQQMPKDQQQMPKYQQQMPKDQQPMPIDQQQMPKDQPNGDMNICTEVCTPHPHKTLEYFCSEHDELGCSVCMTLNHRSCEHVDHIPDIANDILSSTEYVNLQDKITALTKQTNTTIQTSRNQIKRAQSFHTNAIEDLNQVITDIRVATEELESAVVREVDRMETEDVQRLQLFEDMCKMALENVEAMSSRFTSLQHSGQLCQMFIAMKRAKQEMQSIETRLSKPEHTVAAINYRLVTSREAQAVLGFPDTMFTLEIFQESHTANPDTHGQNETHEATVVPKQHETPAARQRSATACLTSIKTTIISAAVLLLAIIVSRLFYQHAAPVIKSRDAWQTRVEHVLDINVRSSDDSKTPWITGSVVLPGDKLVIVDRRNNKLKLIHLPHYTILFQLAIPGKQRDITIVSDTQVAVTDFDRQKIVIVNVSDKLKLNSEVKVKGACQGIASIDGKLVVSYVKPVKVEIISLIGQVLQTVVTEDEGKLLFANPSYVAVSNDQHTIYISDWKRNTVTSVDLSGQVQATYKSDNLSGPLGLTVDSTGAVYVCGLKSHNILQLTVDLTEVQQLLQEIDGVVYPESVSYCETTDRLYVGMHNSDMIKVYQLK